MIVILYGESRAAFVEGIACGLRDSVIELGASAITMSIETALREPWNCREARRVYLLPLDLPREAVGRKLEDVLARLFPNAEVINGPVTHELCCDKIATARRFLARGVLMPETLITNDAAEVLDFVRHHDHAFLKESHSCAGLGHMVLALDGGTVLAGETLQRRYLVELDDQSERTRVSDGIMTVAPPYFLQRLVSDVDAKGIVRAAQVLRAYVVDGRAAFWTEIYRDRYQTPSDFILTPAAGAKIRFLHAVSEEAKKLAVRAAEVLGVRVGAVDLIRNGSEGPFVLEVESDGPNLYIDRSFMDIPEWRTPYDFNRLIAELLTLPLPELPVRRRDRI